MEINELHPNVPAKLKLKGGSSCAIATCKYYSGLVKQLGRTDISFHRYLLTLVFLLFIKREINFDTY